MPQSPPRPDPPPGYTRATANRPYPPPPYDSYSTYTDARHSPQRYSQSHPHPPAYFGRDQYRRHRGDPYYHPYGGYGPPFPKPEYRPHHYGPPLPHPPAPPAPPVQPRPQRTRQPYPPINRGSHSSRSPLRPAFNYYRSQAEYNYQQAPPQPTSSWGSTEPPQNHEDEACSSHSRPEGGRRARSQSAGSRCGSEVQELTPSPVDPEGIRRWEEQHAPALSPRVSSRCGSPREGEAGNDTGEEAIDPALRNISHSSRSSSLHEFDTHDSVADDRSSQGSRADDVNAPTTEDGVIRMPNSQQRPNSEYYPTPHHQAQFATLAKETGNAQQGNIGLNSLSDGEPKDRPSYPIPTIIKCAILGSPHERLTLSELYTAMEERFSFYKTYDKKSWRNSVRHNLSLNNQFAKKERPMTEPGKGHYWVVVPDMPQGNKRERKRNKKPGKRALAAMAAEQARLALLKGPGKSADDSTGSDSKEANAKIPIDPRLTGGESSYPLSVGRHVTATLPANAGSYAAVTGTIPPPALDRHLFRPWRGDTPSSTSPNDSSQPTVESASTSQQDPDSTQQSISSNESEQALVQEVLQNSGAPGPGAAESLPQEPRRATSSPAPALEESSAGGVARTSKTRASRQFNPTTVGPTPSIPRRSAFETLSAALEREGIGATGSGGPASRARRRPGRGNGRASDGDDSESDGDTSGSGDEGFSPRGYRR